ncbi:MAG: Bax inhibitor-1/YccA family protein [Bacteroidetes bacterium]|nr:Bax inhibitor-1/YccA family protein [Bacteroidota bacterium]
MTTINARSFSSVVSADALRTYVQRVYAWMVGGLLLTAVTAMGVASSDELLRLFLGTPLRYVILFGPLALVWFLSARIDTLKPSTAATLFLVYSMSVGIMLSSIFVVYELGSIAQVFFIAAGMYAGAAVYGFTTKRDLTSMGSFMAMGVIGLVLAMIVNMFLGSGPLDFAISILGVAIFTGLTAWDMQRIKEQAVVMYTGEGNAAKRTILSALGLYLNFINLFLFLLRLFGNRR